MIGRILVVVGLVAFTPPALASTGEKLFEVKGCVACHKLKGHKGADGRLGPDLSKIAQKRDREWLAKWIRQPQAIKPGSSMPTLGLTESESGAIADYLMQATAKKKKRKAR